MARDLDADLKILRTILDYAEKRDFERAAALAAQTLANGFEHPLLLNVMATRLEQQGKFEDSLRLLERAVALSPTDVGVRNALSLCLQRLNRPTEALLHIDQLLKLQPQLGFAHANKGNALISLGQLGRARESHLQALALEPANFAATAGLAAIATHRGDHEEARRWAEQTLRIVPGHPDALMSLSAAELANGETLKAEELLHRVIMDTRASRIDKARAAGLLGDVLDGAGRYSEAFDSYAACNESMRQIYRPFAAANILTYVRELNAAAAKIGTRRHADLNEESAAAHSEIREHVFLIGFPRSGTTLLEVVLDGHPLVASVEEHELLNDAALKFMREPLDLQPLMQAGEADLQTVRAAYWRGVSQSGVQAAGKVFIDKYPLNTLKLPLIARLFPRAKILFVCRDPRDVILSCFRRRFEMNPAMYQLLTLQGAAEFYDATMQLAETLKAAIDNPWRLVRYETVIERFTDELKEICSFIGVPWVADLENFAARARSREHATPSTSQLSQGLTSTAQSQWRNYESQVSPIMPLLQPWLRRFGYA